VNKIDRSNKDKYYSTSDLKGFGFTESGIKKFLPKHGGESTFRKYGKDLTAKYYKKLIVDRILKKEEFKNWLESSKNRKSSSANAIKTKESKLLDIVSSWDIEIEYIKKNKLEKYAIKNYNENKFHSDFFNGELATKDSDQVFKNRIIVNYLRHECSIYDEKLIALFGKVGKNKAYMLLNKKIYNKIMELYPFLEVECYRQLNGKSDYHNLGLL
jgi:hypothetical protein